MNGPSTSASDSDSAGLIGVRAVRAGELDAGVVATVERGGVASFDGGTTRVSWWIGAEDRWHRPEIEPSTRDRLVSGTPVFESSVRIPSGDATGRVAVARVGGVPRPSVVFDVENSSPIPVAFAYVVESSSPIEVTADGVTVDGVGRLVLTRPALGYAAAVTAADLVAALEASAMTPDRPAWSRPGSVAVLVPLPHTAHAVATFTPNAVDADVAALARRDGVPGPDRIVAGWEAHLAGAPRLDLVDRHRAAFGAAMCDVLLGPDGTDVSAADPAIAVGLVAEALGRLGRVDETDTLVDLLERQRSNGSVASADPIAATLQLLRACSAWWAGGAERAFCEMFLGPMADAVRWLDKRRQRPIVAASASGGRTLAAAAAAFAELGQPEVAAAVVGAAGRLAPGLPAPASSAGLLDALADGVAFANGLDRAPGVSGSARLVVATLDEAVRDDGDALAILAGWSVDRAGESLEAHNLPTRAGLLSYGVRWHGDRPALLWEVTPWPGRGVPAAVRLTAPALDPTWSATELVGEALLAPPDGAMRALAANAERTDAAAVILEDDPTQQPFQAFHHDDPTTLPLLPPERDEPLPPAGTFS